MRTRKIGPPIADSSRCIRFTTLTCLLCQTVAYRVQQLVAFDVDRQEGSLLPSPDWVEQETLLSSCGWIEVHKDCLVSGSTGSRLFPVHGAISWSCLSFVILCVTVGVLLYLPTQHVFLGWSITFSDVDSLLVTALACRGRYAAVILIYVFVYLWYHLTSQCDSNGDTDTTSPSMS